MSIPSSSSNLSAKSQGSNRPPSSLSTRPPSRTATRTPNLQRPASSLSNRPISSASTRPQSRLSQRPHSRYARSRLIPLCHTLVTHITGLKEDGTEKDLDGELFQEKVEYATKHLESMSINKAAVGVDMGVIDKQISGQALKARLNSRAALGEALQLAYNSLKSQLQTQKIDLDQDIKTAHIPDHLQFLLALSQPPTDVTVEKAKTYLDCIINPPPPPASLTWADILADEPFEGEHWEGIFDRQGTSTSPNDHTGREEWDSTPSLSPLNSDDLALDDENDSFSSADYHELQSEAHLQPRHHDEEDPRMSTKPPYSFEHRKQFEELQSRQYWRDDWHTDAPITSRFNIGDSSTLGPTLNRVLAQGGTTLDAQSIMKPERYMDEDDMVREILMVMQGNRNTVLQWSAGSFKMTKSTPRLIHLSLASQESIISSLAKTATIAEQLRHFTAAVFSSSISPLSTQADKSTYAFRNSKSFATRTSEAFADAIDHAIRGFDAWSAAREEAMCRAHAGLDEEPLVVSLLDTEKAIRDEYSDSFEVLLDIVRTVYHVKIDDDIGMTRFNLDKFASGTSSRRQPAALTATLLDTLFASVQRHLERRNTVTSNALMQVFVRTVEPLWAMIGRWLKDGMALQLGLGIGSGGVSGAADELDDEFFVESSGIGVGMMGLGLLDPEFWKEGYVLRDVSLSTDDSDASLVDSNPRPGNQDSTKKAVPLFLEHVAELILGTGKAVGLLRALDALSSANAFNDWSSFSALIGPDAGEHQDNKDQNARLFSVSIDTLSRLIYDGLLPRCQGIGEQLVQVLVNNCALWKHLQAIEDLFLMRKGDAMSHFVDVLFTKMDSQQTWSDFHFLNTAFNDVVEVNANVDIEEWINASLVRFSFRGSREKDKSIQRTVKAIDGLFLEYAVPFPLIYIFPPKTMQGFNEIFVFLLQIRRAKSVLERILVRDERSRGKELREELKVFYAMRSRLSWFINTLLNFLTTYVIHAEIQRFHELFRKARSLDEMIRLHDDHLEKIRGRCLLKPNTSALHRSILSILDMCLHFSEGFVAFAGDTTATLDVSRQSIIMKRHRSRRQRRQRRNVIGFSQSLQDDPESSDEDEEDEEKLNAGGGPETSLSMLGSSMASTQEDFFARVERMSSELDGLVRFLRRGVESLAGGTSEAASAFGVLAFSLEDWDI